MIVLAACSGLEKSQQEKIREMNAQKEEIYRSYRESKYVIPVPAHRVREAYPWEDAYVGR